MECFDCGKELKGGFGVGERPFKHFHCADCVIRNVSNAQAEHWMKEVRNQLKRRPRLCGRQYKHYYDETEEFLKILDALVGVIIK